MSYEGYQEHICKNGHYYTCDAYDDDDSCFVCGEQSAWRNSVDQTNDNGFPFTPNRLRVKVAKENETCDSCGHTKVIREETYFIPTEEEMIKYRQDEDEYYRKLYSEEIDE